MDNHNNKNNNKSNGLKINNKENFINNDMFIFPNPADNNVNFRYNVPEDGFVKISMYNVPGEKVYNF
jgi:hypothetical protein